MSWQLRPFSRVQLPPDASSAKLFAPNPTADLLVTSNQAGHQVLIYRPPNQVISKILQQTGSSRSGAAVVTTACCWKPDGQFLAIAWSDGRVRLMGLENNKAAHHIPIASAMFIAGAATQSKPSISFISWTQNHVRHAHHFDLLQQLRQGSSTDLLQKCQSLPEEMAFLEVETALPKISLLPTSSAGPGEEAAVFTQRASLEFLFPPALTAQDGQQLPILLIATDHGELHINLHDSFSLGSLTYTPPDGLEAPPTPHPKEVPNTALVTCHASHPALTTHFLSIRPNSSPVCVDLVPLHMPFLLHAPIRLPLLTSKLTTLQKLLRYLTQASLHMQTEYRNTRELPQRFLSIIHEDLSREAHGPRDIMHTLYHTLVTGHLYDAVRVWLADSLGDRGYKRWDKAVVSGLENLRTLVHQNFLPVVDRCAAILSRLEGLAWFHQGPDTRQTGLQLAHIRKCQDILGGLRFVGHRILIHVMEELEQFRSFSAWLQFLVERASGPPAMSEELTEKEASIDTGGVLSYLQTYLMQSPLELLLGEVKADDDSPSLSQTNNLMNVIHGILEPSESKSDAKTDQLKRGKGTRREHAVPRNVTQCSFLVHQLNVASQHAFDSVARALRKNVHWGTPIRLHFPKAILLQELRLVLVATQTTPQAAVDCEKPTDGQRSGTTNDRPMLSRNHKQKAFLYSLVTLHGHRDQVYCYRVPRTVCDGRDQQDPVEACRLEVPGHVVESVRFLSDTLLLLLVTDRQTTADTSSHLVIVDIHDVHATPSESPHNNAENNDFRQSRLPWQPYSPDTPLSSLPNLSLDIVDIVDPSPSSSSTSLSAAPSSWLQKIPVTLPKDFRPGKMLVFPAANVRSPMPTRVCIQSRDGTQTVNLALERSLSGESTMYADNELHQQ